MDRQAVENALTFPVSFGGHIVKCTKQGGVSAKDVVNFFGGPDIVFTFYSLAVGVQGAGEAATGGQHFGLEPVNCFGDALFVKGISSILPH